MQVEDYFAFESQDEIRIKGHRIWIENILYPYLYKSRTAEEIRRDFPSLSLEQVHATILYYLQNKESVNKYMEEWLDYCRKAPELDREKNAEWYEKMRRWATEKKAGQNQTVAS